MDTTHIACTAEDLISHRLQRAGLLVAKPKFDREGADLLVFTQVGDGAKFCRIQCKGRSLTNSASSSLKVPRSHVAGAFILFLFVDDGNDHVTNLFCFFPTDIKKYWHLRQFKKREKDYYHLSFSRSSINNEGKKGNLRQFFFDDSKIEQIIKLIKKANVGKEMRQVFDLLKKQDALRMVLKEKYELESLIKDIQHTEQVKKMLDEKIKIMEEYYHHMENQLKAEKKSNIKDA